MTRRTRIAATTAAILAAGASSVGARRASAAGTFTVSNTADVGDGSLRKAVADANAAGGGTINVTVSGLVTLGSPLPIISHALTVNGNNLVVNGDDKYRI